MNTHGQTERRAAYILILIFVLLAAGIVTAGSLYYRDYQEHYRARVESQISAIANLKVGELVQFRKERLGDAAILHRNVSFSALIRRFLENPRDADAQRQIQVWIGKYRAHYQYDRVFLLDTRGVERMSAPTGPEPVADIVSRRTSEILRSGLVTIQDFYRNEHNQRIHLAVLVPIFDEPNGSRPLGVLVLRTEPRDYLYPFISRWPIPSRTAETLLIRRDGNDALFLNELKFQTGSALNLRIPLTKRENPAAQAALGREGIVEGPDYRGVPVIAQVRRVPDSPWFLVARMDVSEVYAPLRERLWTVVGFAGVLLLGAAGATGFLWRQQNMRFYRERYQAAEALREASALTQILLDNMPCVALLMRPHSREIVASNQAAVKVGAVPGTTCFATWAGRDTPCPWCLAPRVWATGEEQHLEVEFRGVVWDAHWIPVSEDLYMHYAFDITERRQTEAKLAQAHKMESIGRLAGGVAHDFNNLLTVINGYSLLLLGKLGPADPLRAGLQEIHKAGERAAGLTLQLLAFSRKQVLEPRVLDLNREVDQMRSMLGRLAGEDVEVRVELSAQAGSVHADPHQLEQVIMNLVVNARDAMPHGGKLLIETAGVELDERYVQSHLEAHAGRHVLLAVSDSGVGMDDETRRQIFEPFFTTKGLGKGTGLGLSMVQGIVVQSGGHIEVYSEPGHGTTFKVYLPRVEEGAVADTGMPEAALALGGEETVLVVEDQAEVREYAVTVLRAYGYRVIPAESAGEALLMFEREPERIDLALTDVVMPNISGRELANRLEKLQPGIKVLFMSGYTDNVIVHHGVLEAGAQFIQKPFSPERLAARVREVLGPPKPLGRILLADDEAGVRGFLRAALEEGGYEVIEAADGKQALREARAGGVDLVITDIVMPEQDGIETIQTLRKELPGIGIIAISGRFEAPYLKMAEMLGADAVLAKPVGTELLLARVAEVLKSRR
jgi:signal transduction histidine kinase/DNA-binding response OmpR family regulator